MPRLLGLTDVTQNLHGEIFVVVVVTLDISRATV